MKIDTKKVPVDAETMTAVINAKDNSMVYIVEDGQVEAIPLPAYGVLELPCQNYKVGNPAYRITVKRK